MKTSNKLLLTWCVLLCTVPMGYICIYAKAHYKEMNDHDFVKKYGKIYASPIAETSAGMVAVKTPPFKKITINGSTDDGQYLYYVNGSKDYGLKIPEVLKNMVKIQIDKDSNLNVSFSQPLHISPKAQVKFIVYSPSMSPLAFSHLPDNSYILSNSDSVNLILAQSNSKYLNIARGGEESYGVVPKEKLQRAFKYLKIEVDNSNVSIGACQIQSLHLTATNQSGIGLWNTRISSAYFNIRDRSGLSISNDAVIDHVHGWVSPDAAIDGIDRNRIKP